MDVSCIAELRSDTFGGQRGTGIPDGKFSLRDRYLPRPPSMQDPQCGEKVES